MVQDMANAEIQDMVVWSSVNFTKFMILVEFAGGSFFTAPWIVGDGALNIIEV